MMAPNAYSVQQSIQKGSAMTEMHPYLSRYVNLMKSLRFLKNYDASNWRVMNFFGKVYYHTRPFLLFAAMGVNAYGLYNTENYGMYDGSSAFLPMSICLAVTYAIAYVKHPEHEKLIASLNRGFIEDDDPWMAITRDKCIKPILKISTSIEQYTYWTAPLYIWGPVILDFVLHYGFDYLSKPLYLPSFLTPFLSKDVTWNATYYLILAVGLWHVTENTNGLVGFITGYSTVTVYCVSQLVIFKETIRSLDLEGTPKATRRQMQVIASRHNDVIKLIRDLNEFLGLPGAFQSVFTSLTVTLFLFTVFHSDLIVVVICYASGFMIYIVTAGLYCYLGQLLENESEEISAALYDLPWYRYRPAVRKDLVMMMRQAQTPLIVDYHGLVKANLENFMQIVRQSYSFLALLQSVTSE